MALDFIKQLSQEQLGTAPDNIIRQTIGMCNEVYELKYEAESYILRMNQHKDLIYGTHVHLPLFQQLGIPTPSIIAEDYSKSIYPFCYQILSRIPGKDIGQLINQLTKANLSNIAKAVSDIFDKFNTLAPVDSFGGITGKGEEHLTSLLSGYTLLRTNIERQNRESRVISSEILHIYDQLIDHFKSYLL